MEDIACLPSQPPSPFLGGMLGPVGGPSNLNLLLVPFESPPPGGEIFSRPTLNTSRNDRFPSMILGVYK